ncbi:MAG: energy transducer TonB [Bacteroidales bacterium]|nr:energy transducer TonB [Bacteroidales bacterium]
MNNRKKHINKLEKGRGLLLQISIIASLLIVLIIFETKSSYTKEKPAGFTQINLEIEKQKFKSGDIKPPVPSKMSFLNTKNNIELSNTERSNLNLNINKQAQFTGGEKALREYFDKEKQYSEEAKKKNIQGRVNVSFIIDESGKIKDAKTIRSIHPLIDTEALRLINAMPDWKPAEANGKPVESKQILPVIFISN